MPSNLTPSLPTQSPAGVPIHTGNTSGVAPALAAAAETLVTGYMQRKKATVLGELAAEAQAAVSATSQYQSAKDSIVSNLAQSDKATFGQLSQQLERLRKGEVQGVLSPQAANIRLQSLAKTYINRYPRMASEIRQMLKLVSGDIAPDTKSGDIADPVLKAQYQIVEEATARGTSPQDVILLNRQKDATEMSKARLEQAQAEGNFRLPELMFDLVDNKSSEVFSELISGMTSRIKHGSFVKENELTGLRTSMAQAMVDLNKELTQYELETGVRVDHAQFEARIRSAYEPLIALAGEADSTEKQKRFASAQDTILKATDYKYLHDTIGAFAQVAINSPEAMFRFMEELSTTIEQIQKGQLPSLEEASKYDPKTKMLLDQLKSNGKSWDLLMRRADEIMTGKDKTSSTGSDSIDRLAGKIVLDTAAKSGTPAAESSNLLAKYITSGEPIEGVLFNRRTHGILRNSPEAQTALEQQALKQMVSYVMTRPMSELQNIQVDFSDPAAPFKNTLGDVPSPPSEEFLSGASMYTTFEQQPNKFADLMNNYAKVMRLYKDPTETEAELSGKFQELVGARVKNDMAALTNMMKTMPGPESEDGETDEEGRKVTRMGTDGKEQSSGSKKRYKYDEDQDLIIDTKTNRILPDTYTFSPKELEQLQKDLGAIIQPGFSNNPDDHIPAR